MILEPFRYFSPASLEDALNLLDRYGEEGKIIAGGQSLIPIMKMGFDVPYVIDIKKISELKNVSLKKEGSSNLDELRLGCLVTHSEVENSKVVRKYLPLLSKTAAGIGHPMIRNRGTIGGSLTHCDPVADLCTTSLVLNARVKLQSAGGQTREVPVNRFFLGPLKVDIKHNEILTEVIFPLNYGRTGYDVQKLTIGHGDFPLFITSVSIEYSGNTFKNSAVGLGGVADTAFRDFEIESRINGKSTIGEEDLEDVARIAVEKYEGPSSMELSQDYTRKMVGSYLKRALRNSVKMITG